MPSNELKQKKKNSSQKQNDSSDGTKQNGEAETKKTEAPELKTPTENKTSFSFPELRTLLCLLCVSICVALTWWVGYLLWAFFYALFRGTSNMWCCTQGGPATKWTLCRSWGEVQTSLRENSNLYRPRRESGASFWKGGCDLNITDIDTAKLIIILGLGDQRCERGEAMFVTG